MQGGEVFETPLPQVIGTWIAAGLTIGVFSFLYKDNPIYKFCEHLFVGISLGYYIGYYAANAVVPKLIFPLFNQHNFFYLIPAFLGLLYFSRFFRKYAYLARWPIAFVLGLGSGLSVPAIIQARLFKQMQGTMIDSLSVGSLIIVVGVFATLSYFFFSKEHKGFLKVTSGIGIVYIMIGFGATFGYTVMARVSLLIGRIGFLLTDWLGVID